MKVLYVYKITNILNGKKYIGKHISSSTNDTYYGSGIAIKKAIKNYGKDNFKKDVLEICKDMNHLSEREIFHIDKEGTYTHGYNMTKGGVGCLGLKFSKETREKISKANKLAYKNNPETIARLSKLASERVGDKNPFYGKKLTKEHIEKLRVARAAAISGGNNPSAVRVRCIETGEVFNTAKEAAESVGLKYSTTILKCAKKQRKKAGNVTWELVT